MWKRSIIPILLLSLIVVALIVASCSSLATEPPTHAITTTAVPTSTSIPAPTSQTIPTTATQSPTLIPSPPPAIVPTSVPIPPLTNVVVPESSLEPPSPSEPAQTNIQNPELEKVTVPPNLPPFRPSWVDVPPPILPAIISIGFSPSDADNVSWNEGVVTFANKSKQKINAGSLHLSNSNIYYMYAIVGNSALQNTQVFGDAVGGDKVLVAFVEKAKNGSNKALIILK